MAEERKSTSFKTAAKAVTAMNRFKETRTDPEYLRGMAEVKRLAGEFFQKREEDEKELEGLKQKMDENKQQSAVRKQAMADKRAAKDQEQKRLKALAEAEQKAKDAAADELRAAVLKASAAGYDKSAAKSRRTKRCMKHSKFLVKPTDAIAV